MSSSTETAKGLVFSPPLSPPFWEGGTTQGARGRGYTQRRTGHCSYVETAEVGKVLTAHTALTHTNTSTLVHTHPQVKPSFRCDTFCSQGKQFRSNCVCKGCGSPEVTSGTGTPTRSFQQDHFRRQD